MKYLVWSLLPLHFLISCQPPQPGPDPAASIDAESYRQYIQVLASDEFEGRLPASPGEEKTIHYLEDQFKKLGVGPGNGDSYFQPVSLGAITADPNTRMDVHQGSKTFSYEYGTEAVFGTKRVSESIDLDHSELVFVGYAIVAPEYDWNDYKGLDVKGKTVLMLVNDPGFATGDSSLFTGKAMTYYGRWTYKFEEAARQGAAPQLPPCSAAGAP